MNLACRSCRFEGMLDVLIGSQADSQPETQHVIYQADTCPCCLEPMVLANSVPFDCGHFACVACVTSSLGMLKLAPASQLNAGEQPSSLDGVAQPLRCYHLGEGCPGVLYYQETLMVLDRLRSTGTSSDDVG